MVTIKIVIEGGIMPGSNDSAQTINNSEKLREGFYKLFTKIISAEKFNLEIEMGAGEKNACKFFKKQFEENNSNCYLLIDLDGKEELRSERLKNLEIEEYSNFVFFMIQQMEAWILSQPEAIEESMSNFKRENATKEICDDNSIFNKDIEDIDNPADKLNTILSRYFSFEKRDKKIKKKYGKLKDAPKLIENLDPDKLRIKFKDVERLFNFIESTTS